MMFRPNYRERKGKVAEKKERNGLQWLQQVTKRNHERLKSDEENTIRYDM